ncbi:MAG: hypothetical protein H6636_11170 [Anaerolineales bacterium]|nr:hypothetical protein [Anaerolineales bacterium]
MKITRFAFLLVFILVLIICFPARAQLSDVNLSFITIQNIGVSEATVTVTFIGTDGTEYIPVNLGNGITNPFTLAPGVAQQIVVSQIPSLPFGSYSVVISSDVEVVAEVGIAGSGAVRFTGAYTGLSSGATTYYIPTISFNYFGWYGMLSVQNLGTDLADVTVSIICTGGSATGTTATLSQTDIPPQASYTWPLKNITPTGLNTDDSCDGSATVVSNQPIVAVNTQNKPLSGETNTFEGSAEGSDTIYVGGLSNNYYGWYSALTVQAVGPSIDTTVTVDYAGSQWTDDTCHLTDTAPSCKLIIQRIVETTGRYGATITSNNGTPLLAIVSTTNITDYPVVRSNTVRGIAFGNNTFAVSNVAKAFYGWKTAITCQNLGEIATAIHFSYSGYEGDAYNTSVLQPGESIQKVSTYEAFLPDGYDGGATLTAVKAGASIACFAGNSNDIPPIPGDWTVAYNGFGYDR